jgi:hypothetical protein
LYILLTRRKIGISFKPFVKKTVLSPTIQPRYLIIRNIMALIHAKRTAIVLCKAVIFPFMISTVVLQSCKSNKKIYKSSCDANITFKHVSFTKLLDNIQKYDQQYVEIDGTYIEGDEESALVNDSLFVDHSSAHALWVNFSQDCPLYLTGTRTGLFEFNDGKFTQINNKEVTIRGKIDVKHKGHLGSYKASIDRVSYIKL